MRLLSRGMDDNAQAKPRTQLFNRKQRRIAQLSPRARSAFQRITGFTQAAELGYDPGRSNPEPALNGVIQSTYDEWRAKQGLPSRPVAEMDDEEELAIRREYYAPVRRDAENEPLAAVRFDTRFISPRRDAVLRRRTDDPIKYLNMVDSAYGARLNQDGEPTATSPYERNPGLRDRVSELREYAFRLYRPEAEMPSVVVDQTRVPLGRRANRIKVNPAVYALPGITQAFIDSLAAAAPTLQAIDTLPRGRRSIGAGSFQGQGEIAVSPDPRDYEEATQRVLARNPQAARLTPRRVLAHEVGHEFGPLQGTAEAFASRFVGNEDLPPIGVIDQTRVPLDVPVEELPPPTTLRRAPLRRRR
jgi:hypothetical protein